MTFCLCLSDCATLGLSVFCHVITYYHVLTAVCLLYISYSLNSVCTIKYIETLLTYSIHACQAVLTSELNNNTREIQRKCGQVEMENGQSAGVIGSSDKTHIYSSKISRRSQVLSFLHHHYNKPRIIFTTIELK